LSRSRASLTYSSCDPADAVEKVGEARLSRQTLARVREAESGAGAGAAIRRAGPPPAEARVTPLSGASVMTDRPGFTWPPFEKAQDYLVELKADSGLLWKATAREPTLAYPAGEKPLRQGEQYAWTVKTRLPGGDERHVVDEGRFTVLPEGDREALAPVRELAHSDDPEDLLLAAVAYEGHGVYDEALKAFEKLAARQPKVPRYQLALAHYYRHAGRPDRAREALEKAKALGATVGE
jgi:hypothetical protein